MSHIAEANRYLDNAKQLLREKASKKDGYYQDKKYVKMAGHTAYCGVLEALDELFGDKEKGKKSVEWYRSELGKIDRKVLANFITVYEILHLSMGYEGNLDADLSTFGLSKAENIINWVGQKLR